jgi:hypothetical protein
VAPSTPGRADVRLGDHPRTKGLAEIVKGSGRSPARLSAAAHRRRSAEPSSDEKILKAAEREQIDVA